MSQPKRTGRGNRNLEVGRFKDVKFDTLCDEQDMCGIAISASSKKNTSRADRILKDFCARLSTPLKQIRDPIKVTPESSKIVMNLLYQYCKMNTQEALSNDSVAALIQGLRNVYDSHGHRGLWSVNEEMNTAKGNPLKGNEDVKRLRVAHRVHLSRIDRSRLRARPLQIAHVCEHAVQFWFGSPNQIDYRDVMLHALMVIGLNMGLRFDEISKLKVDHVTVHPGVNGTGSIILSITEATKNSTKPKDYMIRSWPGNTQMKNSILVDPFVALLSWLCIRGNRPGYLFCNVNDKNMMDSARAWSTVLFQDFLRVRLRMCGVGASDLDMYSGHSIKRGAVQLYRSPDIRDEQVMEIVQMRGDQAYSNYCAAYNDCSPPDLPRFTRAESFIRHAEYLKTTIE